MQGQYLFPNLDTPLKQDAFVEECNSISERCYNFIEIIRAVAYEGKKMTQPQLVNTLLNTFQYEIANLGRPMCAKLLLGGSTGYYCKDCSVGEATIYCMECFSKSNHKGHSYQKTKTDGGFCDCGFVKALKKQGFCTDHSGQEGTDFKIDQVQTQIFIKEMKFLVFLIPLLKVSQQKNIKTIIAPIYDQSLVKFLIKFNQTNILSNEMTLRLFKQGIQNVFPLTLDFQPPKRSTLEFLIINTPTPNYLDALHHLLLLIFTRPEFARYMTVIFFNLLAEYCHLWGTKLNSLIGFLILSPQIISELIDKKEIKPLSLPLQKIPPQWNYEKLLEVYQLYMGTIFGIMQYEGGIGEKYITWFLTEGNINELFKYEIFSRNNQQQSVRYYSFELIYFMLLPKFLSKISKNKPVILKAIKDIIQALKLKYLKLDASLLITKQRTLVYLLYIYFDGQMTKATEKSFLKSLGLTFNFFASFLNSVMAVMKFYAMMSSNPFMQQMNQEFFMLCLQDAQRTIFSVDSQVLKFCLVGFEELRSEAESKIAIEVFINPPVRYADMVLSMKLKENEQETQERKTSLGLMIDYLGLLHQVLITNHSDLYFREALGFPCKEYINFYGSLAKSLGPVRIEYFRGVCSLLLDAEKNTDMKQFFDEYCEISEDKIQLKKQKSEQFSGFNLSYLKSKKKSNFMALFFQQNMKDYHLNQTPKAKERSNQETTLKIKLTHTIFSPILIFQIISLAQKYLKILVEKPELRKTDVGSFSELLEELIRINYTLEHQQIKKFLDELRQNSLIFPSLSDYIQKQIAISLKKESKQESEKKQAILKEKEEKMKSAKEKKLMQLKQKQNKALEKLNQGQPKLEAATNAEQTPSESGFVCIFCKNPDETEPLLSFNYVSPSTFFSKLYMDCSRHVYKIVSCGHYMHRGCFNKTFGQRERLIIVCNICYFLSNLQLVSLNNFKNKASLQVEQLQKTTVLQLQRIQQFVQKSQKDHSAILQAISPEKDLKTPQNLSLEQKLIQTLASAILEGILVDYEGFTRIFSNALMTIFTGLKGKLTSINNLIQSVQKSTSNETQKENVNVCRLAYKFAILSLCLNLMPKQETSQLGQEIQKLGQTLPPFLKNAVSFIVNSLSQQNAEQKLTSYKLEGAADIKPNFTAIPKNLQHLQQLHEQLCPNCGQKTNELAICLICKFISCVGCKVKSLTSHTIHEHGLSCAFIRIDAGFPILINGLVSYQMKSIYKNYLKEHFDILGIIQREQIDYLSKDQKKREFNLDLHAYEKILKDLEKNRIEQQIEFMKGDPFKGKLMTNIP